MVSRLLLSFAVAFAFSSAHAQTLEEKIDAFYRDYRTNEQMGVAVGIIENGKLTFFKGYGYRDRDRKLPITEETVFAIGSNSKAFTSLAISILADEGKVDLEAPLANQLTGFSLAQPQASAQATAIDLMSHRVGLPRHDLLWYLTSLNRETLFSRIPYLALNPKPGMGFRESFQYNNLLYMTVGLWTERVSGKKWEDFVRERIVDPLGMKTTSFSVSDSKTLANAALPYKGANALQFKNLDPVGPAGSINSNISDLTNWVRFQLNKGVTPQGQRLISESAHARLFVPESDATALLGMKQKIEYGLGWFVSQVNGEKIIWHGGNIDGFSSFISFAPNKNLGVIILTNESNGAMFEYPITVEAQGKTHTLLPTVIYEHLLTKSGSSPVLLRASHSSMTARDRMAAQVVANKLLPKNPLDQFRSFRPMAIAESQNAQEIVGTYIDPGYGEIKISEEGGQARLHWDINTWDLTATTNPDEWVANFEHNGTSGSVTVALVRDQGKVTGISIPFEPEVAPIQFSKQP